jgi:HPt (histidine-containing phosphotransfer) domain-containing protein
MILDTQKFWENFRDLKHLVPSLMASFVKQCPGSLARIEAAISAGDAAALKSAAHAFKGVLFQIYAPRSGALAEDLERRGRAGSTEGAREVYDQLVVEIELLLSAIQGLDYERNAA